MPAAAAGTLIELLEIRSRETPGAAAFTWEGKPCLYPELWEGVNRFAAHLLSMGAARGDRVVLALPNGPEFFFAFYGAQRAGAIPVPLFPGSGAARIASMAGRCGARIIALTAQDLAARAAEIVSSNSAVGFRVTSVSEGSCARSLAGFPQISPDDVAFIQYTSGSTGAPKGVMLSHRGLLINLGQLIEGMQITPKDRFVSWLPVYHDMGLILKTMVPFYLAAELFLLPTNLANVRIWLDAIQQFRATLTAAPDFAYRLCLRYVRNPESFDLSSLRVALNAAEPVRPKTIHEFERIFGLQNVMMPGYGLAEATVGVSTWAPSMPARVDARGIVSVGKPFRGIQIRIVQDDVAVPADQIGEIMVQSPANTAGYYDSRDETERLFWKDGFIRTGDLGYLDSDGFLYVTGRAKNTIKHGGETIFPQEVEGIVDCMPFVRRSAAVGIDRGGVEGEQLYVFVELKKNKTPEENELYENSLEVVQAIQRQLGTRPGRVYLVKPRVIPITFNGKIRYSILREQYLGGELARQGEIFFPDY